MSAHGEVTTYQLDESERSKLQKQTPLFYIECVEQGMKDKEIAKLMEFNMTELFQFKSKYDFAGKDLKEMKRKLKAAKSFTSDSFNNVKPKKRTEPQKRQEKAPKHKQEPKKRANASTKAKPTKPKSKVKQEAIKKAKHLLMTTDKSVKEIAQEAGIAESTCYRYQKDIRGELYEPASKPKSSKEKKTSPKPASSSQKEQKAQQDKQPQPKKQPEAESTQPKTDVTHTVPLNSIQDLKNYIKQKDTKIERLETRVNELTYAKDHMKANWKNAQEKLKEAEQDLQTVNQLRESLEHEQKNNESMSEHNETLRKRNQNLVQENERLNRRLEDEKRLTAYHKKELERALGLQDTIIQQRHKIKRLENTLIMYLGDEHELGQDIRETN